jgi:hypothetical protein
VIPPPSEQQRFELTASNGETGQLIGWEHATGRPCPLPPGGDGPDAAVVDVAAASITAKGRGCGAGDSVTVYRSQVGMPSGSLGELHWCRNCGMVAQQLLNIEEDDDGADVHRQLNAALEGEAAAARAAQEPADVAQELRKIMGRVPPNQWMIACLDEIEGRLARARDLRLVDPSAEELNDAVERLGRLTDLLGQTLVAVVLPLDEAGRRDDARLVDRAAGLLTAAMQALHAAAQHDEPARG